MPVTWDPALAPNATLSNSNRTALATGNGATPATAGIVSSGKGYFEVVIDNTTANASVYLAPGNSNAFADPCLSIESSGSVSINFTFKVSIGTVAATDVIRVAYDHANGLVWVRKNTGLWNGDSSANPATGVGGVAYAATGTVYPYFVDSNPGGGQATLNAAASQFAYTAPTGFAGLDPTAATTRKWLPTDLTSVTLEGWWFLRDATGTLVDGAKITQAGGAVSQWDDASGKGRHLLQATGSAQPGYDANGLGSGRAGVVFGGGSQFLRRSGLGLTARRFGLLMAGDLQGQFGGGTRIFSAAQSGGFDFDDTGLCITDNSGSFSLFKNGSASSGPSYTTDTNHVFGFYPDSSTTYAHDLDGTPTSGVLTNSTANTFDVIAFGSRSDAATSFWRGKTAEGVLFSGVLSTADEQYLSAYLAWNNGTQARLPSGNPYKSAAPTVTTGAPAAISATATQSLAAPSQVATAATAITRVATATQSVAVPSQAAAAATRVAATANQALAGPTQTAVAAVLVGAAASQTVGPTQSASASLLVGAAASQALIAPAQVSTGTTTVGAAASQSLGLPDQSAGAALGIAASADQSRALPTQIAAARTVVGVSTAQTLAVPGQTATAAVESTAERSASASQNLAAPRQFTSAAVRITASSSEALAAPSQVATGAVAGAAPARVANATQALAAPSQVATGTVEVIQIGRAAVATQALPAPSTVARTIVLIQGQSDVVLPVPSQSSGPTRSIARLAWLHARGSRSSVLGIGSRTTIAPRTLPVIDA